MPKVYGYVRASTDEQELTLNVQRQTIEREFAYRFKEDASYEWKGYFVDKGVSAKIHFRQRPEGSRVARLLEEGDVLIIAKLDRGFRNSLDLADTLQFFTERKIGFRLCDLGLDPMSIMGRMVVAMLVAVAEFERSMISLRTREAMAEKKRKGQPCNNEAPYGSKMSGGTKGNRRWVPDPYTRACGKKFLQWFNEGWSHERIYFHALSPGVRLRQRNGKEWSYSMIQRAIEGERRLQAIEANILVQGCVNQPSGVESTNNQPPTQGEDHDGTREETTHERHQERTDDERLPPAVGQQDPGGPQSQPL